VRQEFATHKAVFCSLLLRLSNDLRTKDTQELVDTLLLVWEALRSMMAKALNHSASLRAYPRSPRGYCYGTRKNYALQF
jgi:hypothetical protein